MRGTPSKRLIAGILGSAAMLAIAASGLASGSSDEAAPSNGGAVRQSASDAGARASASAPRIEHFFVLVLENENASATFGANSAAPYLAKTLTAKGAYIPNYFATGHFSLDNYISMISGQGPNTITQADCPFFSEFSPATPTADDQFLGQGCVYPANVKNVANQLEDRGRTWKGYMEDLAAPGSDPAPSCRHPAIGARDTTQSAEAGDQYATRHNPFVYFHSIIDLPTCAANDVDLNNLPADLKSASKTASYSFITPDLCSDGHDEPCIDGRPGGLTSADAFLGEWVPRILASPGYRDHGMLLITFDEAEAQGAEADASACCGEVQGPNTANNGGALAQGPGGGKVGAVALSPCTRPGTIDETPYNHYSQLRFVERNFGLGYLGYARAADLSTFGTGILNAPNCGQRARVASVTPKKARKGVRTRFKVRVKSEFPDCRAGVTVKVGGARAKTNARGIARVRWTYGSTGRKPVTAKKPGCGSGRRKIRVKPAA